MFSKIFKVLIIGLTFVSLFVSANTSKEVFYKGNYYYLSIPEGFCDITDNSTGKFMKNFLNDTVGKTQLSFTAEVIFTKCGNENKLDIMPWGYISMTKNSINTSQEKFNKYAAKNLNESLFNKVEDIVNTAANKTLSEYDLSDSLDLKIDVGKPEILWSDSYSLIVYVRLNDNEMLQDALNATILLPKVQIGVNLYDDVKNNPNILEMASKLNQVAKKIVESN